MSGPDHVLTCVRETELRQIGASPALDRAHLEIINLQLLDAEGDCHRQGEIVQTIRLTEVDKFVDELINQPLELRFKRFHSSPAECLRQQAAHTGVTRWIDVRHVRKEPTSLTNQDVLHLIEMAVSHLTVVAEFLGKHDGIAKHSHQVFVP